MTPWDMDTWARTVWMEARGEGYEGMRAVAHVIHNRWKSGRWKFHGKTSVGLVCLGDRQYSAWNADRTDDNREAMAVLDDNDAVLQQSRAIVRAVLTGDSDPTGGATHYFAPPAAPGWADGAKLTAEIGRHRFYAGVA